MTAMFDPKLIEMWIACGTKFGKTVAASSAICARAWMHQGGLYRWVAPIYSQSKIGYKYCSRILPLEPHVTTNKSEPSLTITAMDTKIEFKSGKFPEDLEGEACNGYVNDECAKMPEEVYDSEKTTTTVTRGPIISISTPRGKNWFYTKCMQAKEEMMWAINNNKPMRRVFLTAPSVANPHVTAEAVEDAKKNLPERLFKQYYLAEFMDDGSVFAGYRNCIHGEKLELYGDNQRWHSPDAKEAVAVLGVDWAKVSDYTVFTAFDLKTSRLIGYERFHKVPYTEAVRRLVLFARKFRDVYVVLHDKTGVGSALDDQLAYTNLPFHGVTFTNSLKSEMVAKLITSVEQELIGLPHIPDMITELDAFEVSTTATGLLSYAAPDGMHDDIVCSLMLSHMALIQYGDKEMSVSVMEQPKNPTTKSKTEEKSAIEEFYNALEHNDDDD